MKVALQLAAVLALTTISVGTAVVAWNTHKLFIASQAEWRLDQPAIHQILISAQQATQQASLFAAEQRIQLKKTSRDSDNQVRAIGLITRNAEQFFYNLDQQVNYRVLPDFDRELIATSSAAQLSMKAIGDNAAAIGMSASALTAAINDPHTAAILANLDSASGHFNVIAANADAMSGDMKIAVHRLAQPPSKVHQALDVGWTAAKFGSLLIP